MIRIATGRSTVSRHPSPSPAPQQGAALVVALVLVLVSTLLGVSALDGSNLEARLVNNEAFRESVFRSAEAASGEALSGLDITALDAGGGSATPTISPLETGTTIKASQRIEGQAHVIGTSLGRFRSYLVSASATAGIDGLDATRTVTQGESIRVLSPQ